MAGKHIAWILRFAVTSAFCFMGGTIIAAVALGDRPDDPGEWVSLVLHGLRVGVGYAVVVLILIFVAAAIAGKVAARRAGAAGSDESAAGTEEPATGTEEPAAGADGPAADPGASAVNSEKSSG